MNGITVTRLSGIDNGIEYRRIDGLGCIPHNNGAKLAGLGQEFNNLGCTCESLSGICDEKQQAQQLYNEFQQRVKNHLINTYNYIVKNRAACGIANPDQVAAAYKNIIDNWSDPSARELAMSEAEKLIQNDEQIAKDFAKKIAVDNQMRSAVLVRVRSGNIPRMTARRRATVVNGLGHVGDVDYELLPEQVPHATGSVVADFGMAGLAGDQDNDVSVSLGSTMVPYSEVDYLGDDGTDHAYVLQGTNKKGKKVQIRINPKNAVKKVKNAVKAVSKTAATVAKAANKQAAQKVLAKTKDLAKKAGKAIIKYNPLFVAGRNGFLLAAKLNLKNISRKMMWGYATLDQAKKAGFTEADWNKSKAAIRKVEDIFVKKAGGSANALRKAVLHSHVAKKAGLGTDPATAAAIAAAVPIIVAVVTALRDVKVAQAGGAPPVLDPEGAGGDTVEGQPTGESQNKSKTTENQAKQEITDKSEQNYQNVSDKGDAADSGAPGNNKVYQDSDSYITPGDSSPGDKVSNNTVTDNGSNSDKGGSNTGLLIAGAAGVTLLAVFASKKSGNSGVKGLDGTAKSKGGRPKNAYEKFEIS